MAGRERKRNERASRERDRRYSVRGVWRDPLDVDKFSKALLGLVLADNERQAEAEHAAQSAPAASPPDRDEPSDGGTTDA